MCETSSTGWPAYAEMRMVIAKVLFHFDLELANAEYLFCFVWPKKPLMVKRTPRLYKYLGID